MNSLEVATFCARTAAEKRARDILVLDIRQVLGVADYFVIATARNKRQIKAIANALRVGLKEHGVHGLNTEGLGGERWVLLDYVDVVVHLFDPETRTFYDLESLWADAQRVALDLPEAVDELEEDPFADPMAEFPELGVRGDEEAQPPPDDPGLTGSGPEPADEELGRES